MFISNRMGIKVPKKVLPTSPIKIFAGCQFIMAKPKIGARIINCKSPQWGFSAQKLNPTKLPIIKMASVMAIPSIPSIKLNRLINHAMARTDIPNIKNKLMFDGVNPTSINANTLAMRCAHNRTILDIPFRTSSTMLIRATIDVGIMRAR
jgi:hypothetical protein